MEMEFNQPPAIPVQPIQKPKDNPVGNIVTIIGIGAIVIVTYVWASQFLSQYLKFKREELKAKTVVECSKVSKYSSGNQETGFYENPIREVFLQCLKDAGFEL
ncbi:hypothetical protein KKD61_04140 [Patescibacteria group bacterium]|nr:hypothetical protein [Patescibacteria group bacterium]